MNNLSPIFSVTSNIASQAAPVICGTTLTAIQATVKEYAELSLGFRRHHYLVGLVLSEFVTVLQCHKR